MSQFFIAAIFFGIDCKELKLAQTAQINQLLQFLNVICIHDLVVYVLSPTLLMSKTVNNDVSAYLHRTPVINGATGNPTSDQC